MNIFKPCWSLHFCPYGPLVENFPLLKERDNETCEIFGHQCPVFTVAENLAEEAPLNFKA